MALIHTNMEEPLERLKAISESLSDAKGFVDTPLSDPMKIAGVFSPAISKRVAKWYIDREMTRRLPVGCACVVTNVMGPPFPLYSAGAKLVQYHCTGILTPGGGLFHAVFSFDGAISISAMADRGAMPDPEFYMQCIRESFNELKSAALPQEGETPKKKGASAKAKAKPENKAKTRTKAKAKTRAKPKAKAKAKAKTKAKAKAKARSSTVKKRR
jgi:hypothetical protein